MIKIILVMLLSISVMAEESSHGGGAKEEKSEGAEGSAAPSSDKTAGKELADTEKQVASLAAKIKAKNDSIEKLLQEKSVEKNPEKLTEIVKLVQQEHRDVEKLTLEYNTQLGILQYRFPERGLTLGRRYQRLNTKSIEEMERTLGLDAHLKKSRERIKTVYGVQEKPPVKKKSSIKKEQTSEESLLQPATLAK